MGGKGTLMNNQTGKSPQVRAELNTLLDALQLADWVDATTQRDTIQQLKEFLHQSNPSRTELATTLGAIQMQFFRHPGSISDPLIELRDLAYALFKHGPPRTPSPDRPL